MSKAVWPDETAVVKEMQSAEWYLAAVCTEEDVDLKGGIRPHPTKALNLALKHAEHFRKQGWAEFNALNEQLDCARQTFARLRDMMGVPMNDGVCFDDHLNDLVKEQNQLKKELLWTLQNLEMPIDDENPDTVKHIRTIRDMLGLNPGSHKSINECNRSQ